jgi:hypothetical protein
MTPVQSNESLPEVIELGYNRILSTSLEAYRNNMPPIGFSIEGLDASLVINKFPRPGQYLSISGRPDDWVKFSVRAYHNKIHDYAVLDDLVHQTFHDSKYIPLRMRQKVNIRLAGADRIAREFTTSRASTKKRWCAALVPAPGGEPYGLLVVFGIFVGTKRMKDVHVIDNPILTTLAHNFMLSPRETS